MSSELAPYSTAKTASEIISPALGPNANRGQQTSNAVRVRLTDDMSAQNLIALLFSDNFDESLCILVRLGPRVGNEGELSNFILHTLLLQILFRLSNPSDLRVSVHDRWDGVVVDVSVTRLDVLDRSDTLFLSFVSEHGPKSDIADTLDARDRCVELVVDHDSTPVVNIYSDVFETETLDVWPATDRDENDVGIQGFLLSVLGSLRLDEHFAVNLLGADDLSIELELDALLGQSLLERLAIKKLSTTS